MASNIFTCCFHEIRFAPPLVTSSHKMAISSMKLGLYSTLLQISREFYDKGSDKIGIR